MTRPTCCRYALALALALGAPALAAAQTSPLSRGINEITARAGTAEFRDIAFGTPATGALSIGKISFTGFVREGERVRADRVEMERMEARIGTRTIQIPTLTVAGFEGSADLFRALTEGGNAERDWIALLQTAAATQIDIERVLDRHPALSFESTTTGIAISNVKDGLIGSARVGGLEGQGKGGTPGSPTAIKIGELRYQGINVSETLRLFAGGGTGEPKRLLERVTMDGMQVTSAEGNFRFDRVEMAGFTGRAPSQMLEAADRAALQSGEAFNDPVRRQKLARFFAELVRSMRVDRYSLEGFSVTIPQGIFSIKAFTFTGLSGRGLDLFEVRNVDVPTPGGPARLGRFALEKLTYGALLDAVFEAMASGKEPDFDPAKVIEIAPRLAAIRVSAVDLPTPEGAVSLGSFDLELDDRPGKLPERIATALKQLRMQIDRASPDEGRKQLLALGYTEFLADAQAQLRWLPSEKAVVVDSTNLVVDKVGRLDISARLGNVDISRVAIDPTAFTPDNARIESLELRLRNLGIAERFYGLTAKSAGISQEAVREGLAAELRARANAMFGAALTPGSADMLAKFLRQPGTVVVRAVPKGGKSLTIGEASELAPPQILERLAITVETGN
jgi:hypothetical protein